MNAVKHVFAIAICELQWLSSIDTLKIPLVLSNPTSVLKSDLELSRNLVGG